MFIHLHLSICLSDCLSVYLSVCLSISVSVSLSLCTCKGGLTERGGRGGQRQRETETERDRERQRQKNADRQQQQNIDSVYMCRAFCFQFITHSEPCRSVLFRFYFQVLLSFAGEERRVQTTRPGCIEVSMSQHKYSRVRFSQKRLHRTSRKSNLFLFSDQSCSLYD